MNYQIMVVIWMKNPADDNHDYNAVDDNHDDDKGDQEKPGWWLSYDYKAEYDDHDDDQNDQEKNLVRSKVTFSSSMYS